jgi:hypothetical protein
MAFSPGDSQRLFVNITARNGYILEQLHFERVANEWKLAFRILRNNETLREHVDPGFPLEDGKTAPWGEGQ